jgi:deoxyribodipyrimidine photo-lyase
MGEIAWGSAELREVLAGARVRERRGGVPEGKVVVYWMQRAQRGVDNHALDVAVRVGNELGLPVVVYFAGIANFPHANLRHYAFLQRGLLDVEEDLRARGVGFVLRRAPGCGVVEFLGDVGAAVVVGDENPMREMERWRQEVAAVIGVPFYTVDADVVVPSGLFERQYGAYTLRPRIYRALGEFLVSYENVGAVKEWKRPRGLRGDSLKEDMTAGWGDLDRTVGPVEGWVGGARAAEARLRVFVGRMLRGYETTRNKPEMDGTSALSPYLHFGHIGAQTICLAVEAAVAKDASLGAARDAFFNEVIVWRELAVNFVIHHRKDYDKAGCAEDWAKRTIAEHARDEREFLYSRAQLENGQTHDALWNAAQTQMVVDGWMHNVMRMYWAKKIVEWTPNVETAMRYAVYLNDKYFLDGRDPNGYAGVAWAILGKFDRAWSDRAVFGKRRYMSGESTGRKFDSKAYIGQMMALRG